MLDRYEKMHLNDLILAKALGYKEEDVQRICTFTLKNELFNKAFKMRENNETLTQEEADALNSKLQEIQYELAEDGFYEPSEDYIIDFNSFVKDNENYGRFCW